MDGSAFELLIVFCYLMHLSLCQFPNGFLFFVMPVEYYPQFIVFLQESSEFFGECRIRILW